MAGLEIGEHEGPSGQQQRVVHLLDSAPSVGGRRILSPTSGFARVTLGRRARPGWPAQMYDVALTVAGCVRAATRVDVAWLVSRDGPPTDPSEALALSAVS